MCRRFGTLFHIHRRVGMNNEDGTECSVTSAYKIQSPGNYPDESIQYVINMYLYVDKEEVFDELKHTCMPKVSVLS